MLLCSDGLIYEPATAVCSGDVGPVDFNGSERFRLNGEMTDKVKHCLYSTADILIQCLLSICWEMKFSSSARPHLLAIG